MTNVVQDKRIGWLKELKVGDRVQFSNRLNRYFNHKVSKISKSGLITVEDSKGYSAVFNADGRMRGVSGYSCILQPYDEKEHEKYLINLKKNKEMKLINNLCKELVSFTFDHHTLIELNEITQKLRKLKSDLGEKNNV